MPDLFPDGVLDNAVELGAIDDRSVRVWVRMTGQERVTATLDVAGQTMTSTIELSGESDWTGVFRLALDSPAPGTAFTVTVNGQQRTGRFAPEPGTPAALTFGFGSCHMPYAEAEDGSVIVREADAAIYPAIRDDLQRAGASLFLLAGDQIYSDELEPISVRQALPRTSDELPQLSELVHRYRRNYRGFFNQTGFRSLREAFPTLCIWDDHDIYDNWGSTGQKTPADLLLFDAACQTYAEYQHARNPDGDEDRPPFHWIQRWGDVALVALDVRGARDYERGVMAGPAQWEWLLTWLAGEASRNFSTIFITSSVPVAHTARWFTHMFDFVPTRFKESIRDRWSSTGFIKSRDQLLEALFDWEARAPHRQVVILSGDVHCASAFTIRRRNGGGVIHQVTSSAMTTPLSFEQVIFNRTVVHGTNLFEPDYRFERHFLSLPNNYGGIRVEPLPDGGHRMIVAIRSWDPKRRRLRTTGRLVTYPEA